MSSFALPPADGSGGDSDSEAPAAQPIGVVRRSMRLHYTCRLCETRNEKSINRDAYHNGIVVVTCSGCDAKHLIADHLAWVHPGFGTIEDYAHRQDDQVVTTMTDAEGVRATWINDAPDDASG